MNRCFRCLALKGWWWFWWFGVGGGVFGGGGGGGWRWSGEDWSSDFCSLTRLRYSEISLLSKVN